MFLCYAGDEKEEENQTSPEVYNSYHQVEKANIDPLPVIRCDSSISQQMNTVPEYPTTFNISEGNNVHNRMQ